MTPAAIEAAPAAEITINIAQHGARNLPEAISISDAEAAITSAIRQISSNSVGTGSFRGRVTVNGTVIEYRA